MQTDFIYNSAAVLKAEISEKFCITTNLTKQKKNTIKNPSWWQSTDDENSASFWNVMYMKNISENGQYPTHNRFPHNQHKQDKMQSG